jgi:hypothetical protein
MGDAAVGDKRPSGSPSGGDSPAGTPAKRSRGSRGDVATQPPLKVFVLLRTTTPRQADEDDDSAHDAPPETTVDAVTRTEAGAYLEAIRQARGITTVEDWYREVDRDNGLDVSSSESEDGADGLDPEEDLDDVKAVFERCNGITKSSDNSVVVWRVEEHAVEP